MGQTTPAFVASQLDSAGHAHEVPATVESMDPTVLKPDPKTPGRFLATGCGRTVVRATYQGRQAAAAVEVTGQRFSSVTVEGLQMGQSGFDVGVRVQAAKEGGRIEYRIYEAGKPPPDHWVAARESGDYQQADLRSPQISYGEGYGGGGEFHLVIEARSGSPASATQYQLWFRLQPAVEPKSRMGQALASPIGAQMRKTSKCERHRRPRAGGAMIGNQERVLRQRSCSCQSSLRGDEARGGVCGLKKMDETGGFAWHFQTSAIGI